MGSLKIQLPSRSCDDVIKHNYSIQYMCPVGKKRIKEKFLFKYWGIMLLGIIIKCRFYF